MYSLYNAIIIQKIKSFILKNKLRILVIVLSIVIGVLDSNLFAIDSLRIASNKAVKHLFPKSPKVYFTKKYQIKDTNTVYLKMNYGSAEILNPKSLINKIRDKRPRVVDLVMTLYPSDLQNWEEDYKELITERLASLENLDSAFSFI